MSGIKTGAITSSQQRVIYMLDIGLNAVPEYPFKPGGEHGCAGNDWPAAGVLEAVRRLREAILEGLEMYGFFHVGRDAKGALAACSAGYADDTHL